MGDKVIRSVYVERSLWQEAKRRGINLSQFVNEMLRYYLNLNSDVEIELKKINKEIQELKKKLAELEYKKQELLNNTMR